MCVLHSIKLICYPRAPSATDWDWLGPKVEGLTCRCKTRFTNLQLHMIPHRLHPPLSSLGTVSGAKWMQSHVIRVAVLAMVNIQLNREVSTTMMCVQCVQSTIRGHFTLIPATPSGTVHTMQRLVITVPPCAYIAYRTKKLPSILVLT